MAPSLHLFGAMTEMRSPPAGPSPRTPSDPAPRTHLGEPPLLGALRDATREMHAQLEHELPPERFTRSLERYRDVLGAFYGFYEPIEVRFLQLANAPRGLPFSAAERARIPALRADLLALGHTPETLRFLPRRTGIAAADGVPEALGRAYVLEGASLGGRVIARRARRDLGVTPDWGARYLGGCDRDTGEQWRAFIGVLSDASAWPEETRARVAEAARDTFSELSRWLASRGVLHS